MRIAALVHNGVLNDARVIKEAMTLRAAGYEVDIHGIAPHEQAEHHILPGTDIEVFLEPRAAPRPAPPPPSKIDPRVPDPQVVMNASMIAPVPVYDGRLHDAAQLPREQKIILFQGGFSPHRGLPQLVEAANALPAEWTLVMMGWGGMEAELRAMVNHHSRQAVSPTVVFLPGVPQHELQQWSAGATLGVIPYENTSLNHLYCTPNKLWEYPSAGVPVLCSDLIEMTAVLEKYEFGFLLPREFSSADIVSVVSGLSAERLATARVNCASWLDANNWSVWERNLLAIYDNIRIARQAGDGRAALVS